MLKIGLLGASKIAPSTLIGPVAKSDAFAITVLAARDPARARAYADTHGIGAVAENYAALVQRDDIDIVYNGLPPAGHAEWTIAALEAGKTVLCEKPFARNAQEASEMVAAAKRTGRLLLEAFHYRHHRVMHRALDIVASGVLGPIRHAEAHFNVAIAKTPGELRWSAEQGGGGLMDLGCYPLHALRTLISGEPEVLSADGVFEGGVDAEISADLRFPGDVGAKLSCSMTTPQPSAALTLTGARGSLTIVNFVAPQLGCRFTTTIDGVTIVEPTEGPSTYDAQLENMRAVLLDGAAPITGGDDAIANMTVIDAIYRAAGREHARAPLSH